MTNYYKQIYAPISTDLAEDQAFDVYQTKNIILDNTNEVTILNIYSEQTYCS
jgi:hypothetical protein